MPEPLALAILVCTGAVLALLLPFAAHRSYLLWLARTRSAPEPRRKWKGPLPRVTVQLPVYNERHVVERLVDAACRIDYPRSLLQIQVLDDSTDDTSLRVERRIRRWREQGIRIEHVVRGSREGYKAGALAQGLDRADGELLLVLDADFVPSPDMLRRLLPPFMDPGVGMVQARWDHLNEEESWLTRAQALLLDGHFFFEQGGRYAAGRFFNFNGTAGLWRRACVEEAGGWEFDTLTEDLDLSYRAQMAGWRFVFLEDVGVPAEVPGSAGALEVQQRRWAQGGIQTARKILPGLLRGPWPWPVKLEAVVHLCGHLAHPLTLLLGLLLLPSALASRTLGLEGLLGLDVAVFAAATLPFLAFYAAAGRKRDRPWKRLIPDVLRTLALGVGLSAPVSRAVLRGFVGSRDPFLRTPKRGGGHRADAGASYPGRSRPGDTALKLALAGAMAAATAVSLAAGFYASLPFLLLFGGGWLALGVSGLRPVGAPSPARDPLNREPEERRDPDGRADPEGLGPDAGIPEAGEAPVAEEYEAA